MNRFPLIVWLLFMSCMSALKAQTRTDTTAGYKVPFTVEHGDTIGSATFDNIYVYPQPVFESRREERRYWRLIYNVKVVYPYAKLAQEKLKEMNEHFLTLKTDRQRKEYVKQVEKDIRSQFEGRLRDLTITQGRLLIKLIDRETGQTSYALVKQLRGSFSATFWQTIARLFGSNLKTTYDPLGKDKPIEDILKAIDAGYL